MGIPQEGYLKDAGADHFCVLQDEPLGKKTDLAEEGAFLEIPGKKRKVHQKGSPPLEGGADSSGRVEGYC